MSMMSASAKKEAYESVSFLPSLTPIDQIGQRL